MLSKCPYCESDERHSASRVINGTIVIACAKCGVETPIIAWKFKADL